MKYQFIKLHKSALSHWSDYTGFAASALCLIHCWALPVIILILPGIMVHHELAHPVLGSAAILSTVPLFLKKSFYRLPKKVHYALVFGIMMLLATLLNHDHISFIGEVLLNTAGGFLLSYVHFKHLRSRKIHSHS